ncbi:hypothetical protein TPB0596_11090 [Tsukamurella pulmonis]|uniref:DUF445 domain-containing protein n=1 Tax=Tsukamurella pulmonis TaxID=47312 RepID=A0A1H1H1N2_9ACTN|nr:DUF445 family protein [Tsukamurella pulmonis]KXO88122.1 hypothetical protein AXK56_12165 [Tsukamurella pulmonis]KXP13091.1 hypothetical protein AXK57_02340 [Tsukamurella pulmonis]SDR18988.1 Protein of unknown function [Tsukamurella pulmonis]SUP16209.1 Protein of uncharacterised function (DUF445) [Tsukamurella pulmonis]BDD81346.1 hypothetical protein TPB0596_11090 [Tsukamurella pulmonis]
MQSWAEITADVQRNWLIYVSMPIIAALIGYGTKVVAIRMMFRPHQFKGIGKLGWQGIIPKRAPQMVEVLCDTLTDRLVSASDILEKVDADELGDRMERQLRREVARIVPVVAAEYQPALWNLLPGTARDLVVQRAQVIARDLVPKLVVAIRENIDEVFDLKEMVTREVLADPDVLERMFLDVGRREFAFIRNSGLVFGFLIGLLQAACWALFRNPWIMPLFGLFTGWFTDWAALRLIFNPKEPTKYLGFIPWQGLFLKHRIPVSEEYGALIATRVLTAERLVRSLFTGPQRDQLVTVVAGVLREAMEDELPSVEKALRGNAQNLGLDKVGVGPLTAGNLVGVVADAVGMVGGAVGGQVGKVAGGLDMTQIGPMSRAGADDFVAAMPVMLADANDYLDARLDIRTTMVHKMAAMTPDEFEGVLRPAFQADEKTLIMVGAILGFLVGELQVLMVEHLTH